MCAYAGIPKQNLSDTTGGLVHADLKSKVVKETMGKWLLSPGTGSQSEGYSIKMASV
jgi:hypothetical protein